MTGAPNARLWVRPSSPAGKLAFPASDALAGSRNPLQSALVELQILRELPNCAHVGASNDANRVADGEATLNLNTPNPRWLLGDENSDRVKE